MLAIILANLLIAYFGPEISILNAFLFIGLDLTTRDRLHEIWHGKQLFLKMSLLIAAGSILSYWLNEDAGRIALASFLSFALAGMVDAVIYHILFTRNKSRMVKINGSNIFSAAVDSIAFPTIAFGTFLPGIIVGQFFAKVFGGFFWSVFLSRKK